jgi:arylsulfatase A-like enzyme
LFWHYPHYSNQGGGPASAIRYKNWKLIHWYENDRYELFDLKNDLSEKTNLIATEPKKARQLKTQLEEWLKREKALYPQNKE